MPSLAGLVSLNNLHVEACPKLYDISSYAGLASLNNLCLKDCPNLSDMPSLAGLVSLNNLHVENYPKLYDMSSLAGLASLNKLCIKDCPNLYDMPNLGGLVSFNNLCVQGCPRIMKIECLEHLRSLEKLNVQTDWMVPGIHSLRCAERLPLRTLTLRAADISAFGACIESIGQMEKWPCEMTLCGKFFASALSILDNFTFPGLVLGEKMEPFSSSTYAGTTLRCEHTNPSDAAIVCFHVKIYEWNINSSIMGIESGEVRMSPGEWIVMTVLREVPLFLLTHKYFPKHFDVSSGSIIVGERGDVIAGFKQLFQTLCEASHN